MKRFAIPLQAVLGLALLFAGAYLAVEAIVGPSAELESQVFATSNARLAAAELASAWEDLVRRQRRAGIALQDSAVLSDLGASIRNDERRDRALHQALESARAQLGGAGQVALIGEGMEMIVGGDDVGAFAKLPGTLAALDGGPSTRLERLDAGVSLVTSIPLGDPRGAHAALILATPMSRGRLHRLVVGLPTDAHVLLAHRGVPITGTLDPQSMTHVDLKAKGASIVVLGDVYAMHRRGLDDDSASQITAVGLAKIRDGASAAVIPQVRLLLGVLFGALVLMLFLLGVFAPTVGAAAPVAADSPSVPNLADLPDLTSLPNHPSAPMMPTGDPAVAHALASKSGSLPTIPAPPPPAPAAPSPPPPKIDFINAPPPPSSSADLRAPHWEPQLSPPSAPPDALRFPQSPSQSTDSLEAQFAQKTMPASRAPDGGIPLPPISPSRGAQRAIPAHTTPPPPVTPTPASPFDAIAQAARSSAPPRPASSPSMPGDPDDLPAPKGGVSPEVAAAQRADAQRMAHQRPAPKPSAISFAPTPYDPELLEPKRDAIPLPGSTPSSFGTPNVPPPGFASPPPGGAPAFVSPPPSGGGPFGGPSPFAPSASSAGGQPWGQPSESAASHGPTGTVRGLPPSQVGMSVPSFGPQMASTRPAPPTPDTLQPFDEAHYRSVYDEFVGSKAQLGEAVDSITYEGFRTKLRSSEQALLDRHKCRAVRFQVLVRDRTVSLRPQLVR